MPRIFDNDQPMWARLVAAALCAGVAFHPSVSVALIEKVVPGIAAWRGGPR